MLAQQLAMQESYLAGRLTKFGENHKVVREAQELINRTKQEREMRRAQIAEQLRQSNLLNARDQLVVLQSTLEDLERRREEAAARKKDLDSARVQYKQRKAIRDERKQMVDSIKEQIEKLRIVREDPETPKVQFVAYAPEPLETSFPKAKAFFPAGTVIGFMFGIGLAFLIELLNDLVRTPRDVGKYLHIPLLAVIPHADEDEQVEGVDLCHVVRQAPYSIISESYRRFRTNLKLSSSAESLKVLLVSSGLTGEGKTSVAVNLAATFIAEDKKVLLIDANFRRPTFHAIFPRARAHDTVAEKSDFGLSNLLMGHCDYQDVIRPSGIPGMDVIDTGPLPLNPAELLDRPRMEGLIKQQRENYDHIIIDAPPLLLVSDSKILARFTNGLILVFNAGITRRGTAQRTIRELREINATIVGCVLLGVKAMKGGYFREQFESYKQYQQVLVAHSV
jgi:capsular exopolysaccharide synthesis family protein